MRGLKDSGIEYHFSIVGDGRKREWLAKKIAEYDLSNIVTFCGIKRRDEVYEALLNSHILLLPSLTEGLPIVLLEAQACGCVPVASRLPGATDVAVDVHKTGLLVEVGNINQFVAGISKIASDAAVWSAMSEAGHKKIAAQFTLDCLGRSYSKLIDDALNGKYQLQNSRRRMFPIDLTLFGFKEYVPYSIRHLRHKLFSTGRA